MAHGLSFGIGSHVVMLCQVLNLNAPTYPLAL